MVRKRGGPTDHENFNARFLQPVKSKKDKSERNMIRKLLDFRQSKQMLHNFIRG